MHTQHARNKQVSKNIRIQGLYLYNKTRYVAYSRPNGWTEWAETFCGHSEVMGGCFRQKIDIFSSFKKQISIFSTGNAGPFS